MTVQKKLANSIAGLEFLAKRFANTSQRSTDSFEKRCKTLETLFKNAQDSLMDQERAYVLLLRFRMLFEIYNSSMNDKTFLEKRFGSQLMKSTQQIEQLKKELCVRYSNEEANGKDSGKSEKESTSPTRAKKFPEDKITCDDLYSALNNSENNILLVDARPEEDFRQSRIKIGNVINVPDHVIQSGMSAHCIGECLPDENKKIWDKRETFEIIILFDWNSTDDNMTATKLEKLLSSLVDWDSNKTYVQKPIILNGGYFEWGQKYPSMCVNPNIVMNKVNNELDELLNLDDIEYPSDEAKIPLMTFEQKPSKTDPTQSEDTREELIRRNKELAMQSDEVMNHIISQEYKWNDLNSRQEVDKLRELEKTIASLEKQFEDLTKQKNKTQEEFELYARFDPQKEKLEQNQIKEIADIDKAENEKIMIRETIAQQRLEELARARALKPKASGDPNIIISKSSNDPTVSLKGGKTDRPVINRAIKPSTNVTRLKIFNDPITFNPDGGGLVGLKNIRNTCYMNTIVQCMRTIPKLAELFCTGAYRKYISRKPDAIIIDTALLFRSLWSNINKSISPVNFYDKVCSIEPNYKMGNHEDCMEFFLFLLNNLSEDCAHDILKPQVMTPVQEAWINQLGGKMSLFSSLFYHTLRITQFCDYCRKKTYKIELESTLMLPIPEHDFRIEDLMTNYLKDYIIDDYCCSECKRPVTNSKEVYLTPEILVIVLKRYKQVVHNNNVSVSKVDSRVSFPISCLKFGKESYSLNSIAMHSGSMTSGHYTAAALINEKWYEFNDEIVRPINIQDDSVRTKACAFFYSKN